MFGRHGANRRTLLLSLPMLGLLVIPIGALGFSSSPGEFLAGIQHPLFGDSLWLSLKTTLISLVVIVLGGTPLAWWLANRRTRSTRWLETLVDLPIVLPPAVMGIALLQAFGRGGPFSFILEALGLQIPFTTSAVVLAQCVVAAPFYIQSSAAAFRRIDPDLLLVARTLGASPRRTFFRVVIPLAAPGLVSGAALAWARGVGEFGATLLFAGNLSGMTQTMPLAIYSALESDLRSAIALSLVLAAVAVLVLLTLRTTPLPWVSRRSSHDEVDS